MKVVIVGNGVAAVTAAETIREGNSDCEIVMISKEDEPFYSPCFLAEYLEGSIPREHLFLRDRSFYGAKNIRTRFGSTVVGVNPGSRVVRLAQEGDVREGETYDRLLLACGAEVIMPPIPGLRETSGVFAFKTIGDVDQIQSLSKRTRKAVVIGSGFIGLEAAQALARKGLQVTIIEALGHVLPNMADEEVACLVSQRLQENGIEILTDSPAEAVLGGPVGVRALMAGGREIPCDLIVCAAGVRANLSLVEGTGIDTGMGIIVDAHMRTSIPDIYAAGDIIEMHSKVRPNWPNAVTTGRIAGYNILGRESKHTGLHGFNVVRIFEKPVAAFGARNGENTLRWEKNGTVRKIFVSDGRIVGGQLWGDVNGTGVYHQLMNNGNDISAWFSDLAAPSFGYGRLVKPGRLPVADLS